MKQHKLHLAVTPLLILHIGFICLLASAGITVLGILLMRERQILCYLSVFRSALEEITVMGALYLILAAAVGYDRKEKEKREKSS